MCYLSHEGDYFRFFSYLNLFMFFMLILVLAANYVLLFVGWEGVGLASYLLIGFYFLRKSASDAGKKAFIVNRIGDFGFMLGMFLLFRTFHTLDFTALFQAAPNPGWGPEGWGQFGTFTVASLLLFMGACGKSAQLPLYVWLPDAMEGPTPVSALIHAATMVTAGVYVVARSHVLFTHSETALVVVAIVGCATAFFAATIGLVQTDIKKVLAYSTVSQLGYMFLACGVGAFSAGIFHLMTHAFFKALLFLAAGSVIHAMGGEQDMNRMGGLSKKIRWTYGTMLVATFAITGIPFFANFFAPVFGGHEYAEAAGEGAAYQLEMILAGVAVGTALIGLGVAYWLYLKRPEKADGLAKSMKPVYTTLLNKYYVDELYAAVVVKPLLWISANVLWKTADVAGIDGAVNGIASGTTAIGDAVRHTQSGNTRSYAGWDAVRAL